MHTLTMLLVGFGLLGLFWLAGPSVASRTPQNAARLFIPVWLAVSIGNLWVGVSQAGYTVAQEAPILLAIFIPPAVAAWYLSRR
jgi:apolipoprotein N-acyltransferase